MTKKNATKKQSTPAYRVVPLDRISRDRDLWVRAAVRLQKAGLLRTGQPFKLFIQAA